MPNALRNMERRHKAARRYSENFRLNVQRIHEQIVRCIDRHWEITTRDEEIALNEAKKLLAGINAGRLGAL